MTEVERLLEAMTRAGADLPPPDEDPGVVLEAVERMMDLRREAFEALQAEVARGAAVTETSRQLAARLQAQDRAWAARVEVAMKALRHHLGSARRLREAYAPEDAPHAAKIQV